MSALSFLMIRDLCRKVKHSRGVATQLVIRSDIETLQGNLGTLLSWPVQLPFRLFHYSLICTFSGCTLRSV
jgi:hypothetical protein